MKLVNRAIDFLQAQFPPNRVVVLLGGLVTALAGIISAWLAANFPGLNLGTTEIAIVLSAVLLIGARLVDKWFDQWQRGEDIDAQADLEAALDELLEDAEVQRVVDHTWEPLEKANLSMLDSLGASISELRTRAENGNVPQPELVAELGAFADAVSQYVHRSPASTELAAEVDAPAPA